MKLYESSPALLMPPKISVCIPAYNRAQHLEALLDSIVGQNYADYNIVICEDDSPEREAVAAIARRYQAKFPDRIIYHENSRNLGYDGNLRECLRKATGDYALIMGNDDLLAPNALSLVASAIERYPNVGVVLRSYQTFRQHPDNVQQIHRYFPSERFFQAGEASAATFFRRVVVISGLVIRRRAALAWETDEVDGTLLYQVYLVGNILLDENGVFLPQPLAYYRLDASPDFGNSEAERNNYVPGKQTAESSLHFVRGFLEIAERIDVARGVSIHPAVLKDTANYSYPLLAIQAKQLSRVAFASYAFEMGKLGLGRSLLFQVYFLALLLFGPRLTEAFIAGSKRRLGFTPTLGRVYSGDKANTRS